MDCVRHITSPSATINESALTGEPIARCSIDATGLAGIQAAAGGRDVNAAWVIDTVVPRKFLKTSTQASNCLANTSITVVPGPELVLSNWPSCTF
jgi:hypothetical protein